MRLLLAAACLCFGLLFYLDDSTSSSVSAPVKSGAVLPEYTSDLPYQFQSGGQHAFDSHLRSLLGFSIVSQPEFFRASYLSLWIWDLLVTSEPFFLAWGKQDVQIVTPMPVARQWLSSRSKGFWEQILEPEGGLLNSTTGQSLRCHRRPVGLVCSTGSPPRQGALLESHRLQVQLSWTDWQWKIRDRSSRLQLELSSKNRPFSTTGAQGLKRDADLRLYARLEKDWIEKFTSRLGVEAFDGSLQVLADLDSKALKQFEIGLKTDSLSSSARLFATLASMMKREGWPYETFEGELGFHVPILPYEIRFKRRAQSLVLYSRKAEFPKASPIMGPVGFDFQLLSLKEKMQQRLKTYEFQRMRRFQTECKQQKSRGIAGQCPLRIGYAATKDGAVCPIHDRWRQESIATALFQPWRRWIEESSRVQLETIFRDPGRVKFQLSF